MKAFGYVRTSSAANVGTGEDPGTRQLLAIEAYAAADGIELAREFYDAAVKGAEPITARRGFAEMLTACTDSGVCTILLESANRFARDLIIQETGCAYLRARGIALIAVDDPGAFTAGTANRSRGRWSNDQGIAQRKFFTACDCSAID
jgi:DNA invertase Pin-like site-specific DNA recombinase